MEEQRLRLQRVGRQGAMSGGVKRVFLVEDETLILMALQSFMEDLGYEVAAAAQAVDDALAKASSLSFDVAVLDVNVGGHRIDPVADLLALRGIPFLFTTGYGKHNLPPAHEGRPYVPKPYRRDDLQAVLGALSLAQ